MDRQGKIPSFDEVMAEDTSGGRVPSFADIMGEDEPVKKKDGGSAELAGSLLSGGLNGVKKSTVDQVNKPVEEVEVPVDEADPLKTFSRQLLSKTTRFGQHDYSGVQDGDKLLPREASKAYNAVSNQIFPHTSDALRFLEKNDGKIKEGNETAKVAKAKILRKAEINDLFNENPSIESMAAKFYGEEKFDDLREAKKGRYIDDLLNLPEVREKASEDANFNKLYYTAKANLYNQYPSYAISKIKTKISQKMEDERLTSWFYSDPSVKTADKAVGMLVNDGDFTPQEKHIYDEQLRPLVDALGGSAIFKTTDLVHSLGRGLSKAVSDIEGSARDIVTNKILGGLPQELGLVETNEDRRKRLEQEQYSDVQVTPKGDLRKAISGGGEFLGFTIPMILGGAAKVPQMATAVLMFEGDNADKAREMFPKDGGKQNLYTLLSTTVDASLLHLLPTKKASEGVANALKGDVAKLVEELASGKITEQAAKETMLNKITESASGIVKGNVKTANALSAFQVAHNGIDAAFGKRDFNVENELKEAVGAYKSNFLSGTFLSAAGAIGKGKSSTSGKAIRELAENPEAARELIKGDPEKTKNLETAVKIGEILNENMDLSEPQKDKLMGEMMRETVLREKEKNTPTEVLKAPIKKEIAQSQLNQEKTLNPEISNTELIEKHYDEDLLPKGFKKVLEDENGKFSEHKVGEFLKEVAHADPEKVENIPNVIVEVAKERWPEGKTEEVPEVKTETPEQETKVFSESLGDKKYHEVDFNDPLTGETKKMTVRAIRRTMEKRHETLKDLINCLTK